MKAQQVFGFGRIDRFGFALEPVSQQVLLKFY